jgi:hypothetical protein
VTGSTAGAVDSGLSYDGDAGATLSGGAGLLISWFLGFLGFLSTFLVGAFSIFFFFLFVGTGV